MLEIFVNQAWLNWFVKCNDVGRLDGQNGDTIIMAVVGSLLSCYWQFQNVILLMAIVINFYVS